MGVPKSKKRENYVSYPTDDEHVGDAGLNEAKNTKKTRRNTLKEQNINIQNAEMEDITEDAKKPNRVTRQTRKLAENHPEDASTGEQDFTGASHKKKNKKSKKKKLSQTENLTGYENESVVTEKVSKKSKTIKKFPNSIEKVTNTGLNRSNISTDSFHSAAGSPLKEDIKEPVIFVRKSSENLNANTTFEIKDAVDTPLNTTFEKDIKSENRSSLKNSTFDNMDCSVTPVKAQTSMFAKVDSKVTDKLNKFNTTFEAEPKTRRSLRNSNVTDNNAKVVIETQQNSISKRTTKTHPTTKTKLNSTYDKNEITSSKSSLISSDSSANVTFDKPDNSRISIKSDDSKTENIINTTPVMIESSMDESNKFNMSNNTKTPDKSIQEGLPLLTPLKREGTYTKEGPEVTTTSSKPKISSERTPTKRMSLPSPGFTPYRISQTSQSSQKEKISLLNVTRSIEKTTRRSSLVELVPRQTRVMFCSPVNNPGVMTQQKKKVIKSSMKGSDKSFVFEENGKHCSSFI